MADQTVDGTDVNLDDLTGRSAGENITIRNGGSVRIDSCPHLFAGILGDVTIESTGGLLWYDGRGVKEIDYSSGSGTLPSVGDTITWDSGSSTGKVVRLDSGNNVSGTMTVAIDPSGTYPSDTFYPLDSSDTVTDGTWSASVDVVDVGFLAVFGENDQYQGNSSLCEYRATGNWYEVGTGDGTNSQTMTMPHSGHQHAIWGEVTATSAGTVTTASATGTTLTDSSATFITDGVYTGMWVRNTTDGSKGRVTAVVSETEITLSAGLSGGTDDDFDTSDSYEVLHGVYDSDLDAYIEPWHRVGSSGANYYTSFDDFSSHQDTGKVFQQSIGSSTVTFGATTTGGGVPANGAKFWIPNIHLGTTTTGSPGTENSTGTADTDYLRWRPNNGTIVNVDHTQWSTVILEITYPGAVTITDSSAAMCVSNTLIQQAVDTVVLSNFCFVDPGPVTGGIPHSASTGPQLRYCSATMTLTDCLFYCGVNSYGHRFNFLSDVTATRCQFKGNRDNEELTHTQVERCSTMTFSDCVFVDHVYVDSSSGITFRNCRVGTFPGRTSTERSFEVFDIRGNDVEVNGVEEVFSGGAWTSGRVFDIYSSDDVRIRNVGRIDAKIDIDNAYAIRIGRFGQSATNVKLQRIWMTNCNGDTIEFNSPSQGIVVESVSGDYAAAVNPDSSGTVVKGLHGASGSVNTSTGVDGDYTNTVGTVFVDTFKSDTTGALQLVFNGRGTSHAADVSIEAGTPVWNGIGDLLLRTSGDQVIYEWPHWIKGHTAFQNAAVELSGTNTGNLTYEYDLDTGSGYSGSWSTCNGTNLSAESIAATGFKVKIRITCSTTSSSNSINGFAILTNTTLAAQSANFYPLSPTTTTFHCVDATDGADIVGARVFVKAAAGGGVAVGTQLLSGTTDANGLVSFDYDFDTDQPITGWAREATAPGYYQSANIFGDITAGVNATITVPMIPDE